jgi:hypothetical protein
MAMDDLALVSNALFAPNHTPWLSDLRFEKPKPRPHLARLYVEIHYPFGCFGREISDALGWEDFLQFFGQ